MSDISCYQSWAVTWSSSPLPTIVHVQRLSRGIVLYFQELLRVDEVVPYYFPRTGFRTA